MAIHEELKRHGELTLLQLWLEYATDNARAYRYSRYCELYHRWKGKLDPTMRQRHRAGEKEEQLGRRGQDTRTDGAAQRRRLDRRKPVLLKSTGPGHGPLTLEPV